MTPQLYSPTPQRCLKRKLTEFDQILIPSDGKRPKTERPILNWLSSINPLSNRPVSAPPSFDSMPSYCPGDEIRKIPQQSFKTPTPAPTTISNTVSTKAKTDDPGYPQILYSNGIIMDRSGRKMPSDIKAFVNECIVNKHRSSPPLTQEEIEEVIDEADLVANSCEVAVSRLLDTKMFPFRRAGVGGGGGASFSSEPLPNLPDAFHKLAVPKPDRFFGYTAGQAGSFTRDQNNVISHPFMTKFAQPTLGSAFPWLVVEVKSEARGGTVWHAENQAAGSGSHCVSTMRWLMEQVAENCDDSAGMDNQAIDTVAFSICFIARQVLLYVHSVSKTNKYFMSLVSVFMPTDGKDVQKCRDQIKNIMDFGINVRRPKIVNALDKLYPFPETWPQKMPKLGGRSKTPSTTSALPNGE